MATPGGFGVGDRPMYCLRIGLLDLSDARGLTAARIGGVRSLMVEGVQLDGRPLGAAALTSPAVETDPRVNRSPSARLGALRCSSGSQLLAVGFTIDYIGLGLEDRIRTTAGDSPAAVAPTARYTNSPPVTRIGRWLKRHLSRIPHRGRGSLGVRRGERSSAGARRCHLTSVGAYIFLISPSGGVAAVEIVAAVTGGRAPCCSGTITKVDRHYVDVPVPMPAVSAQRPVVSGHPVLPGLQLRRRGIGNRGKLVECPPRARIDLIEVPRALTVHADRLGGDG